MSRGIRFKGKASGGLNKASKAYQARIKGLKDGTIKPYTYSDLIVLNPELVDDIFKRIK